jgi:aryl-alcohol dehydrogenase (NADP+)
LWLRANVTGQRAASFFIPEGRASISDQRQNQKDKSVEYRQLGRSGLKISPICLGTMMFGGPTDEATSARIIAKARDAGVNFIDTADAYSNGNSESVVGRAISNNRPRWVLATKLANPMGDDPNRVGLSRRWVLQAADESLKRLGTGKTIRRRWQRPCAPWRS